MNGTITTFVKEKGFGFIKGDDGKDYFFHIDSFNALNRTTIMDGQMVEFEPTANSKGYKAVKCNLLDSCIIDTYDFPDIILYSKNDQFKNGYKILCDTSWLIEGSSRHAPDDAKSDLLNKAKILGANAVHSISYFKTTGSEAGTGKGTHHYTIHNYAAIPCIIGKPSMSGKKVEVITKLNDSIKLYKDQAESYNSSALGIYFIFLFIVVLVLFTIFKGDTDTSFIGFVIFIFISVFGFGFYRNSLRGRWIKSI
jgi:cold shock CspA family protein